MRPQPGYDLSAAFSGLGNVDLSALCKSINFDDHVDSVEMMVDHIVVECDDELDMEIGAVHIFNSPNFPAKYDEDDK
jgi:hypothetical protein